jgi:hypothetical protein
MRPNDFLTIEDATRYIEAESLRLWLARRAGYVKEAYQIDRFVRRMKAYKAILKSGRPPKDY